ncbi:MAG TPA: response regulator, partial [Tepidisphaeraceae bacterium]
ALTALEQHPPQLILLDLAMPQMDGLTFLRHLRAMEAHKDTPVILCTALANRDIVRIAASHGVRDYLLKSEYTIQTLLERVGRYLPTTPRRSPVPTAKSADATFAPPA